MSDHQEQITHNSPFKKMSGPNSGEVTWTSGFWARYFELSKDSIIPSTWEAMQDPTNSAVFSNFYVTAGLRDGEHLGVYWGDGDCYKWMEAMSHVYSGTGDEEILAKLDELIDVIAQAQDPDGYISTQIQLDPDKERWSRRQYHELYNMGHLLTSASVHHEATGQTNFLEVAVKLADYLYDVFSSRPPELAHYGFNPSNIMGMVDLYRVTGDKRYLELAGIFVDMRGSGSELEMKVREDRYIRENIGDQNQDRVPLREETEAVGHAVTAMYLYAGAADVYAETGDTTLLDALERIWDDVVNYKMYVTGAVGAYHHGASIRNDNVHEAFGRRYELPNATAYNETCANIGNAMFSWRMLNITGEAKYADVMETVIYNSALSPVSIDGKRYFYTNPLRWYGNEHHLLKNDEYERKHTYHCYCCPTQVARNTAWMNRWAYSVSEDGIWVNIYSGSRVEKMLSNGTALKLDMETNYPWDGHVKITMIEVPTSEYSFHLRIPGWADGTQVRINNGPYTDDLKSRTYLTLSRMWESGDTIEIEFPMEVRLVRSHPLVEENRNHVAVMRGPVVYCIESSDFPAEVKASEIYLSEKSQFESRFAGDVLGGVTLLETEVFRLERTGEASLYSSFDSLTKEKVSVSLIPYFAWANRGISSMAVWIPLHS